MQHMYVDYVCSFNSSLSVRARFADETTTNSVDSVVSITSALLFALTPKKEAAQDACLCYTCPVQRMNDDDAREHRFRYRNTLMAWCGLGLLHH